MISENLRCQSMMSPARDYQERYQCGWTPGSAEPTKCSNIWALCENVEYSSYWWQAGTFQLSMKRENIFFAFHEKGECLGYQCKGEILQLCLHDVQCRVDRSCPHTWGKTGRRGWQDWDAMDMKLNFGFRPGHKDRWGENWLSDTNDNWPKETLTRWKGVNRGCVTWSAEFQETRTASGSQPLQQTYNDTINAYHRPRLWGVMAKAS